MLDAYNPNRTRPIFGVVLSLPILAWAAWQISQDKLKPVALVFAGLALLVVLLRRNYRRVILVAAFGGIVLGWRGFEIASNIRVYPSELFIWLGLLHFVSDRVGGGDHSREKGLSPLPLLLVLVSLMGVAVALINFNSVIDASGEFQAFMMFFPIMILLRSWVTTTDAIRSCLHAAVVAGTIIAALGLVERFFPSVSGILPSFFPNPISMRENFRGTGDIALAGFSFWGTPTVSTILVPIVGLCVGLQKRSTDRMKVLWVAAEIILIGGIIVAGYRSSWLGLIALFCVLFFVYRTSFILYVIGAISTIWFLPTEYLDRFNTIIILTKSGDSSILRRAVALEKGFQSIWDNPLWGTGWGSPAIFNDWLYIAVALGIPALIIFAFWYADVLGRLWRRITFANLEGQLESKHLAVGFFAGLAGYSVCMISGAMSQVPPLMTTFWLIFCLGERLTKIEITEPRMERAAPIRRSAWPVSSSAST